jgi:hypothetical protein
LLRRRVGVLEHSGRRQSRIFSFSSAFKHIRQSELTLALLRQQIHRAVAHHR